MHIKGQTLCVKTLIMSHLKGKQLEQIFCLPGVRITSLAVLSKRKEFVPKGKNSFLYKDKDASKLDLSKDSHLRRHIHTP